MLFNSKTHTYTHPREKRTGRVVRAGAIQAPRALSRSPSALLRVAPLPLRLPRMRRRGRVRNPHARLPSVRQEAGARRNHGGEPLGRHVRPRGTPEGGQVPHRAENAAPHRRRHKRCRKQHRQRQHHGRRRTIDGGDGRIGRTGLPLRGSRCRTVAGGGGGRSGSGGGGGEASGELPGGGARGSRTCRRVSPRRVLRAPILAGHGALLSRQRGVLQVVRGREPAVEKLRVCPAAAGLLRHAGPRGPPWKRRGSGEGRGGLRSETGVACAQYILLGPCVHRPL
ncbi:unnamed protein product, partial [Ectocarpus sp. 13 AM-2016]